MKYKNNAENHQICQIRDTGAPAAWLEMKPESSCHSLSLLSRLHVVLPSFLETLRAPFYLACKSVPAG